MPHEDSHRHRARRPRTVEHRLAGGHHRNPDNDSCLSALIVFIGLPAALVVLAAMGAAGYLNT